MKRIVILLFLLRLVPLYGQEMKLGIPIGHSATVTHANFLMNDRRVLTTSKDGTFKLWDVATGKLLLNIFGTIGKMDAPQISQDGSRLLVVYKGVLKLWDLKKGQIISDIQSDFNDGYYSFNSKGDLFSFSSSNKTIVYAASSGLPFIELENTKPWEKSGIDYSDFSPDGKYFAFISSSKNAIYIHDILNGKELFKLDGSAVKFQYSPDGKSIASFDLFNNVKVWDAQSGLLKYTLSGHKEYIQNIHFSPNSNRLVSIELLMGKGKLWNLESGEHICDVGGDLRPNGLAFTPDSKELIINGFRESNCWNTTTGQKVQNKTVNHGSVEIIDNFEGFLFTTRNGAYIKGSKDESKKIELEFSNEYYHLNSSSDGKKIIGLSSIESIPAIWDVGSGKLLTEFKGFTYFSNNAYLAPSATHLITESNDQLSYWTLNNNLLTHIKNPILDSVELIRFSPDGNTIVILSSNQERKVGLYNTLNFSCINPDLKKKGIQNITMNNEGSFKFTEDSKKIFISNNDWGSYLFDSNDGSMVKSISHGSAWFSTINDLGSFFLSFMANEITLIDLESDAVQKITLDESINSAEFVGNQDMILVHSNETLFLYDLKSNKPKLKIKYGKKVISKNGQYLFIETEFSKIVGYDLLTCKKLFEISTDEANYEFIADLTLSSDNKNLIYSTNQGDYFVVNSLTGELIHSKKGNANKLVVSDDGKYLFGISAENVLVFDAVTFDLMVEIKVENNEITYATVFQDKVFIISNKNMVMLWEIKSGKLICSQPILDEDLSFVNLPSGYYKANIEASKQLYYLDDQLNIISMDQLEVKFNRPDLVLKATGNKDTLLINSYYRAYQKRMKKLGIDTLAFQKGFSYPVANFTNKDAIQYDQREVNLILSIKAFDSTYQLDRFNIWINEVPIFGEKGCSLKNRKINKLDTTIIIQLSEGENRIETSITNQNAIESFRSPLYVKYTPAAPSISKTHFIGIGIDKFAEPKHDLSYSVKDVRDLAKALKGKFGDQVVIDTLFNENVSVSNVQALKKRLLETNINDKVIISYSGHGLLSAEYDYYLSSYSVDFNHPENGGIPYEVFEDLLDSIPARKKLLLIDACHSGEIDKEENKKLDYDLSKSNEKNDLQTELVKGEKGVKVTSTSKVGLENSFQLMQELFVNVQKSSGSTVISAAGGDQAALEGGGLQNGFFTYAILELLNSRDNVTVNELKAHVLKEVLILSGGKQRPTSRVENLEVDWKVW